MPFGSSTNNLVNVLAVENPQDPDLGPHNLVQHAIVPDTEFPIPLQGPPEGRPKLLGSLDEADLNRMCDSMLDIGGESRKILIHYLGVVEERIGHSAPRRLQAGPDLVVGQSLLAIEGLFPFLGESDQHPILLALQSVSDEVPHLQGE